MKSKDTDCETVGEIEEHTGQNSGTQMAASVDNDIDSRTNVADAHVNCDSEIMNKNVFENLLSKSKAISDINNCDKNLLDFSSDDVMDTSESATNVSKTVGKSEMSESIRSTPLATNSANNCDQSNTDIASNLNELKPSSAPETLVEAQAVQMDTSSPKVEKNIFDILSNKTSSESNAEFQNKLTHTTAEGGVFEKSVDPISEKGNPEVNSKSFTYENIPPVNGLTCIDKGCDTSLTTSKTLNDSHIQITPKIPEIKKERCIKSELKEIINNNNNVIVNGWKSTKAKRKQQFLVRNEFNVDTKDRQEAVLDTVTKNILANGPLTKFDIIKWKKRLFGRLNEHRIDASKCLYFRRCIGSRFSRIRYECKMCGELYQYKSRFKKHLDGHDLSSSSEHNSRLCPVSGLLITDDDDDDVSGPNNNGCSEVGSFVKVDDVVPNLKMEMKVPQENMIADAPTPTPMTSKIETASHSFDSNKQSSLQKKIVDSIHITQKFIQAKRSSPSINIRRPRILATPNISKLGKKPAKSIISTESPSQRLNGDLLANHAITLHPQPTTIISSNNLTTLKQAGCQQSLLSPTGANCSLLVPQVNQIPICSRAGIMTVNSQLSTFPMQSVSSLTLNPPSLFSSPIATINTHQTYSYQVPSLPAPISSIPMAMSTCVPATNILSVQSAPANPVIVQQSYQVPQTIPTFGVCIYFLNSQGFFNLY